MRPMSDSGEAYTMSANMKPVFFVGKGVANIGHGLGVGIKICSVQESYHVACACFDTLVDGVVAAARFSAYNPAAASLGLGENSFSFRCVAAAVHYYMLEFHSRRQFLGVDTAYCPCKKRPVVACYRYNTYLHLASQPPGLYRFRMANAVHKATAISRAYATYHILNERRRRLPLFHAHAAAGTRAGSHGRQ